MGNATKKIFSNIFSAPLMKNFNKSQLKDILKRLFDLSFAFLIFLFSSPITIPLLIFIPLTSKGPAIYKQERLGKYGKPFWIYKFRSMTQHAEKDSGPVLAIDGDPRITFIGYFLRATRLDELPQLFNVFKGDMSLVGPRPERAFFVEQYIKTFPEYAHRMNVKPGITGYAQVNGTYHIKIEEKLAYDLYYIKHYSLWLDIKILFSTFLVILNKEKSRGFKSPS